MSSSASRTQGSRPLIRAHLRRCARRAPIRAHLQRWASSLIAEACSSTPHSSGFARLASGPFSAPCPAGSLAEDLHPRSSFLACGVSLALLITCIAAWPALAAEVWLDVSKAAERKIVIAVPPLAAGEDPEEATLRKVLENDLVMTGYFRLLPIGAAQLAQAERDRVAPAVNPDAWAGFGAELLLWVESARRDGRLVVKASLIDVGVRAQLFAREETDAPSEAPRLAHRVADAVMRALTGQPGLAMTRIAATWSRDGAPKRVVITDYDGRNQRPLSADGTLALHPAWFPDGTRVAYVTYRQGRPEIVAQNVTTGQVRSLAFFPGLNSSPAISPDGRNMLLVLSRDGNPEVYRMAVDGSELKRLTFTQAVETSPVWSPDGSQIALVSDQGGGPQINLLGANGGRMRRVSFVGNYATSPDWSPRGGRIVFTALIEGTFQLVLLDPATGDQSQLTFDGEHKENPSFAPDGRHVVFSQGRGKRYRLAIVDIVTGERSTVTRETGSYTSPAWSP